MKCEGSGWIAPNLGLNPLQEVGVMKLKEYPDILEKMVLIPFRKSG